ncbi:MAG: hypothetical protein FJY98_00110 [Candidatus Liptonbacteria bacterium]|nr:hypothetical protein [Candidatus Liptonbacteria bacterium]
MRVYVAGKFEDKEAVYEAYRKLTALGHSVSYDWTTHKNIKPYDENKEIARQYARNEMQEFFLVMRLYTSPLQRDTHFSWS